MSDYYFQTLNSKYKSYRSPYITKKEQNQIAFKSIIKNSSPINREVINTENLEKKTQLNLESEKKDQNMRKNNPNYFEYKPLTRNINYRYSEQNNNSKIKKFDQNQTLKLGSQTDIISLDHEKEKIHNYVYDRQKTPKMMKDWSKSQSTKNIKAYQSFEIESRKLKFGNDKNEENKVFESNFENLNKKEDIKNRASFGLKSFQKTANNDSNNIQNRFNTLIKKNSYFEKNSDNSNNKSIDRNFLKTQDNYIEEIFKLKKDINYYKEKSLNFQKDKTKNDFLTKKLLNEIEILKAKSDPNERKLKIKNEFSQVDFSNNYFIKHKIDNNVEKGLAEIKNLINTKSLSKIDEKHLNSIFSFFKNIKDTLNSIKGNKVEKSKNCPKLEQIKICLQCGNKEEPEKEIVEVFHNSQNINSGKVLEKLNNIIKNINNENLKYDLKEIKNDVKNLNCNFLKNEDEILLKIFKILKIKTPLEKSENKSFYLNTIFDVLKQNQRTSSNLCSEKLKREQGIQTQNHNHFLVEKNNLLNKIEALEKNNENLKTLNFEFDEKKKIYLETINNLKNENRDIIQKMQILTKNQEENNDLANVKIKNKFLKNDIEANLALLKEKDAELIKINKELKFLKDNINNNILISEEEITSKSRKNLLTQIEKLLKEGLKKENIIKNLTLENKNNLETIYELENKFKESKSKNKALNLTLKTRNEELDQLKNKEKENEKKNQKEKILSKSLLVIQGNNDDEMDNEVRYFSFHSENMINSVDEENEDNHEAMNEGEMKKIEIFIKELVENHEMEKNNLKQEIKGLKDKIQMNLKYKADFEILEQKVKIEDLVKNQLISERDDLRQEINKQIDLVKKNTQKSETLERDLSQIEALKEKVEILNKDKKTLKKDLREKISENDKIKQLLNKFEEKDKEKIEKYQIMEINENLNDALEKNINYEKELNLREKEIKSLKNKIKAKSNESSCNHLSEINYLKDTINNLQEDVNDLNELLLRQTEELEDHENLEKELNSQIQNLKKKEENREKIRKREEEKNGSKNDSINSTSIINSEQSIADSENEEIGDQKKDKND